MFSTTDTIVAIATPPGRGGIGVVRVSGGRAHEIAMSLLARSRPLEPRHATTAELCLAGREMNAERAVVDRVVATYFPGPASYTGDDVVEISAHGSPVIMRGIVGSAIGCGARLAEPGEFTLRAYVNGRMDLMQAEAVADLIDAVTPLQARAAFDQLQGTLTRAIGEIDRGVFDLIARLEASVDFPEEGYHFVEPSELAAEIAALAARTARLLACAHRGRLVREGLEIAIVGPPNAGKSTLFNALVGAERAIVTNVPGTTRDLVSETMELEGLSVTVVDTAGLRETDDVVELEGVARSKGAARVADLILLVVDLTQPGEPFVLDTDRPVLVVANKCDLNGEAIQRRADAGVGPVAGGLALRPAGPVAISALTGEGMEELRRMIVRALDIEPVRDTPAITNVRHIALVERAHEALMRARDAVLENGEAMPEEFVLADLQEARAAFEEISGRRASDDLLAHIFSRFCIGK